MTEEAIKKTTVRGTEQEQYISTYTHLLDWAEEDTLIVKTDVALDIDLSIDKRMAGKLLAAVNMTAKSKKALSGGADAEKWPDFKKVFQQVAGFMATPIQFKVDMGNIVGIVMPGTNPMSNADMLGTVLPKIHGKRGFKQVHISEAHQDLVVIYKASSGQQIEFCGYKWIPGCMLAYSSLGHYDLYLTPCLIPFDGNPCAYSIPASNDDLAYYVQGEEAMAKFLDQAPIVAEQISNGSIGMAKRWEKLIEKEISMYEFENLCRAFYDQKDSVPEMKLISRYAQALDCFNLNPDDDLPGRDWFKTAWSGTRLGEFLRVAFTIPVSDAAWVNAPNYAVAYQFEGKFTLDNVAIPRKDLTSLTWD